MKQLFPALLLCALVRYAAPTENFGTVMGPHNGPGARSAPRRYCANQPSAPPDRGPQRASLARWGGRYQGQSARLVGAAVATSSSPVRAQHGMVVSQESRAAGIGADVLRDGGTAIDAAVATAFALAVTHPTAGNIGGGGFLVLRPAKGEPAAYDFREMAPARATPTMFLRDGKYDHDLHHDSHLAVGVPGTVAGLHMAWKEKGRLPWRRLVDPAIALARDGFPISDGLAR